MRFISFRIFILCILLPPVFYVLSVQYLEKHLKSRYADEIEDIYIGGDTRPLLEGNVGLKDAINKNIGLYFQNNPLIPYGVRPIVTVITKGGAILYPPIFEEEDDTLLLSDPMQIAADNYKLMNEGLVVKIDVKLDYNKPISIGILASYILLSLFLFYLYYRGGLQKAKQAELEKNKEIERLLELEKTRTDTLKSLERDREKLASESLKIKKALEDEKVRASKNEEGMIEEIVTLEDEINKNLDLQEEQQEEIRTLKEELRRLEKGGRKESKKIRGADAVGKRFKALYKNISVSDRAVSGFIDLADDLKIKSEEVIHQLNENSDLVSIKRKVFGKKSKHTILEVIFGYKGRLYFSKTKDSKIDVLAIGTKNSQVKDLEYLDNLTL